MKYIESTKLPKDCILSTLDVSPLYTNTPTEDGIYAALQAIENWENKLSGGAPTPAGTSVFTKHNWDMGMGYLWLNGKGIYHLMGGAFMA